MKKPLNKIIKGLGLTTSQFFTLYIQGEAGGYSTETAFRDALRENRLRKAIIDKILLVIEMPYEEVDFTLRQEKFTTPTPRVVRIPNNLLFVVDIQTKQMISEFTLVAKSFPEYYEQVEIEGEEIVGCLGEYLVDRAVAWTPEKKFYLKCNLALQEFEFFQNIVKKHEDLFGNNQIITTFVS